MLIGAVTETTGLTANRTAKLVDQRLAEIKRRMSELQRMRTVLQQIRKRLDVLDPGALRLYSGG